MHRRGEDVGRRSHPEGVGGVDAAHLHPEEYPRRRQRRIVLYYKLVYRSFWAAPSMAPSAQGPKDWDHKEKAGTETLNQMQIVGFDPEFHSRPF